MSIGLGPSYASSQNESCGATPGKRGTILDLSICIVSFNVVGLLRECLESAAKSAAGMSCEVIVVDNASADGTSKTLAEDFPWVRLIANKENLGYAPAANQALALCRGRYILTLNPDTVLQRTTLSTMLRFMEGHPEAGAAGCKMVDGQGNLISTWHSPHLLLATVPLAFGVERFVPRKVPLIGRSLAHHFARFDEHTKMKEVTMLDGAFVLLPRHVVETVGYLDESLVFGADDYDWCYRIARSGKKIFFVPDAQIVHLTHQSWSQAQEWTLVQRVRSWLTLILKWRGRRQFRAAQALILAGFLSRALTAFALSCGPRASRENLRSRARILWRGASEAFLFGRKLQLGDRGAAS